MEKEKLNITYIDASGKLEFGDFIIKGKDYTVDDCVLVRTTDVFPFDGIVRVPKNDGAYDLDSSNILGDTIKKVLKEKVLKGELKESDFEKELKEFDVVFEICRSTTHWAINGLVSSGPYGNFNNKACVVFDKLKHHLNKSLKTLRVEDTYFTEDISLSADSCILISTEFFKLISTNIECMETLQKFGRIFIYDGNQEVAVKKVLEILGYDAFLMGDHSYTNSDKDFSPAMRMTEFIHQLANKYDFGMEPHYYSEINNADRIARLEKSEEIEKLHLFYIIDNSNVSQDLVENIKIALDYGIYFNDRLDNLLRELVNIVGLDRIKQLTKEFNEEYIENLHSTKSKLRF